ncbi:hypothetical protein Btru_060650 [Bulinus truncatus]|nr:hypothetical protein Btru_060650 [Bulinus truncatus]
MNKNSNDSNNNSNDNNSNDNNNSNNNSNDNNNNNNNNNSNDSNDNNRNDNNSNNNNNNNSNDNNSNDNNNNSNTNNSNNNNSNDNNSNNNNSNSNNSNNNNSNNNSNNNNNNNNNNKYTKSWLRLSELHVEGINLFTVRASICSQIPDSSKLSKMKTETGKQNNSTFPEAHPPEPFIRSKRRSLKRHKSLSSSDTSGPPDDPPHVMSSDASDSTTPAPVKSKHRIKLWNSFLNKTKHIRIRKKDKGQQNMPPKLHRRSSSQPNIPAASRSSSASPARVSDDSRKVDNLPNGLDHPDGTASRRAAFRQQQELTRSESSLNDSSYTPKSKGSKLRGGGQQYRASMEDDGYRSYVDQSSASAYRSMSDTALTPETDATLSLVDSYAEGGANKSSNDASIDRGEDDENDEAYKENEEMEDDVPILVHSSPLDTLLRCSGHSDLRDTIYYVIVDIVWCDLMGIYVTEYAPILHHISGLRTQTLPCTTDLTPYVIQVLCTSMTYVQSLPSNRPYLILWSAGS